MPCEIRFTNKFSRSKIWAYTTANLRVNRVKDISYFQIVDLLLNFCSILSLFHLSQNWPSNHHSMMNSSLPMQSNKQGQDPRGGGQQVHQGPHQGAQQEAIEAGLNLPALFSFSHYGFVQLGVALHAQAMGFICTRKRLTELKNAHLFSAFTKLLFATLVGAGELLLMPEKSRTTLPQFEWWRNSRKRYCFMTIFLAKAGWCRLRLWEKWDIWCALSY